MKKNNSIRREGLKGFGITAALTAVAAIVMWGKFENVNADAGDASAATLVLLGMLVLTVMVHYLWMMHHTKALDNAINPGSVKAKIGWFAAIGFGLQLAAALVFSMFVSGAFTAVMLTTCLFNTVALAAGMNVSANDCAI